MFSGQFVHAPVYRKLACSFNNGVD
jgi:hypothetical protein